MSTQPTGNAPGGIPYYVPPPSAQPQKKEEPPPPDSSSQAPNSAVDAAASSTTMDPRNAEALIKQAQMQRQVERDLSANSSSSAAASSAVATGTVAATSVAAPSLPKDIEKQISTITGIATKGIFTPARCRQEGILATLSADANPVDSQVCLNYVYSNKGIGVSLTQAANGGLSVVLERPPGSPSSNLSGDELLTERSERVQHSFLVVMPIKKHSSGDALLELETNAGEVKTRRTYLTTNQNGCSETRAHGSILPQNFAYILIPEHLQAHLSELQFDRSKIIFVTNCTETIGEISITCPNYRQALERIIHQDGYRNGMLTHMLRCPTARDLS